MIRKIGYSKLTITPDALVIEGKNAQPLGRLGLVFRVGETLVKVVSIEKRGGGYCGLTNTPGVTVDILPSVTGVSVEVKGDFAAPQSSVVYFESSTVSCLYGRAFVPDADCRLFETQGKEEFILTNSGMIIQKKLNKGDLWMMAPPPHVISFGDEERGWFGVSIPEPLPVVMTKFKCQQRDIALAFDNYSPAHRGGRLPRVFIDLGLEGSKAILDRHREHAGELGLIVPGKKAYAWWHNPVYCTWGDQCYIQKTDARPLDDVSALPMDEMKVMHWADGLRSLYPGEVNYIIDAGWFDYYGDYQPKLSAFKTTETFRDMLAKLKQRGFRVILWYTPFWVQPNAQVEREHPEYLLRTHEGSVYRDSNQRAFLDYSNPAVREHVKGIIEYLLKTLDADGFKIDMNYAHPLMTDVVLHDPAWGYGNQFWFQVMKFFHACATAVKEDAFFTISGVESYLQPYACSVRLNDLFEVNNARAWYNRAELVARLMPEVPIDVDGWPSSLEKIREYQFVSPVFGAPVTYYIDAVDIMTVKLTDAEKNRMASVWHVYSKVPCETGMRLTIDADHDVFERRDAQGRLQALALQKGVFVGYTNSRIYLTSNADRAVSLPVEVPSRYTKAERVWRDGRRESVNLFKDETGLVLNVLDSASGLLCYEIS